MAIKARKITIVKIGENDYCYYEYAVEFYDDLTNKNIDPTKTTLTSEEIIKMANDAFEGS